MSSARADRPPAVVGAMAPGVAGITLDGSTFDLTAQRGHPVVINFWGPSCIPCRDEFPLFAAQLTHYASDGLVVVGVLTDDAAGPARDFVTQYGGTWPTVIDPGERIKDSYQVAFRPQTYFVDAAGVIRSIQYGEVTAADFQRQYAKIAP